MAPIPYDSVKSNSLPLRVEGSKGVGKALLTGLVNGEQPACICIGIPALTGVPPEWWLP